MSDRPDHLMAWSAETISRGAGLQANGGGSLVDRENSSGSPGLSRYMERISRFPMLTPEEEGRLRGRIGADPDDRSREELVAAHLRLVIYVAKRYRNRGLPFEDLIAEGNLGLVKAARKFDPKRETRFMTCAVWWIRKAILEALDRNASLVRMSDHMVRTIRQVRAEAILPPENSGDRRGLDRHRRLDMTYPEMEMFLAMRKPALRLDPGGPEEGKNPLLESLVDDRVADPQESVLRREARARIRWGLARLMPREQRVLSRRYGMEDERPRTLKEVGRELGVSHERARQVESEAKRRLRRLLSYQKRLVFDPH